ncbi:MAG: RNA degradosome polyphosphate kinase [Actinomycetaceae bacterium]|nr:RNA degradosome polyphosphate kinase [Actinomycetaceae bacterium]
MSVRVHNNPPQNYVKKDDGADAVSAPTPEVPRGQKKGGSSVSVPTSASLSEGHAHTNPMKMGSLVSTHSLMEMAKRAREEAKKERLDADQSRLPEGRFADRELSWLAFNERVLEQAEDKSLPILERAWFLAIFASNLDEFFMVRVAGLKRRIAAGVALTAASGLTPRQVLDGIAQRSHELMERHARVFADDVQPKLANVGIDILHWASLKEPERERLRKFFKKQIFPVLTPLSVDPSHPFPYISGLSLNIAVIVRNPTTGKELFARVKIPPLLPRFIAVDADGKPYKPEDVPTDMEGRTKYVPLEEVIGAHLDQLFPGMQVVEFFTFRVTRNEDMEVEEDDAENLLTAMERELLRRRFGPAVRLEVEEGISEHVLELLKKDLSVGDDDVFRLPAPLDLTGLNVIHDLDRPSFKYSPYVPVTSRGLKAAESSRPADMFRAISEHDILLHHPYESFSTSVQQFLAQAAADPNVLAIKQTLYRTSGDSPIIDSLIKAARAGKQVLAIVEIKARFDEERNIEWARQLEHAGVHVVYGVVGLKTHCKLCLVVRQEDGVLKRYCHIGTGNYNPKTVRGYEDLGLLTCDPDVGQDLTRMFNQLSGFSPQQKFNRLLASPRGIRKGLIKRIEREIDNKKQGRQAWIKIKVNSIVDEATIDALYRASQAGVQVDIQVRGICAVRAGIPGLSENIRVRSILGRYLEHSRIYAFYNNGDPDVFIGSADLMHRNLDRRVEALVKITDPEQVARLVEMIDVAVSPKTSSWHLETDGWVRHTKSPKGNKLQDIQELLMRHAHMKVRDNKKSAKNARGKA